MANGSESFRGALEEAGLPVAIAVPASRERSESPLGQAVHRLRKSTTAVIGVVIVVALVLVAIFADVLAPDSPIASDQTHTLTCVNSLPCRHIVPPPLLRANS